MKGIRFRYQSIATSIQQLLLQTKSSKAFIFGLKKIVLEWINVASIMMEESDTDANIRLAFSEMSTLLKKSIQKHNAGDYNDSQSQESERQNPYENDYDEVTVFLNSRRPLPQTETNRGQFYKFLSQAEDRQRDLQEILGNFSNMPKITHQKNSKLLRQKSEKNKFRIPNFSQENTQTQTDICMEAFNILIEESHIYKHYKHQIERSNGKNQEHDKIQENTVINQSKKSLKKIDDGKNSSNLQKKSSQSLLQKKGKNSLQASKRQIVTYKDPRDPLADKKSLVNNSKSMISKGKKQGYAQRKLFSQQSAQTNQIFQLKSLSEVKSRQGVSVPVEHELSKELQTVEHQDKRKILGFKVEHEKIGNSENNLNPSVQIQESETNNGKNFKQQQLKKSQALLNAQSDMLKQKINPNVTPVSQKQKYNNCREVPLSGFASSSNKTKNNKFTIDIKSNQNTKNQHVDQRKDAGKSSMAMLPHINLRKSENKLQKSCHYMAKASSVHNNSGYTSQSQNQNTNCSQYRQHRDLLVVDQQKSKKAMKKLQLLIGDGNLVKNNRKIQLYIQDIVSIHERECGKGCVHLTRFYQFLLKKNIPHRKQARVHHKNINFEQQISHY